MCYQIAALTKELLPGLLALEKACFQKPWTEGMFLGELNNPAAEYRVILYEGLPVAYMGMWCVADEGQITNVAVSPLHRRKGLAKQLIMHFIKLARAKQLSFLTLEVREHNQGAISLYEAMGFCIVGRRRRYYEGKEDALLMTLLLGDDEAKREGEKQSE